MVSGDGTPTPGSSSRDDACAINIDLHQRSEDQKRVRPDQSMNSVELNRELNELSFESTLRGNYDEDSDPGEETTDSDMVSCDSLA